MALKGFIHCLATDSHDVKNRHAGHVRAIAVQLKSLIGIENLKRIALENPARVIQGETLLEMDLGEVPKRVRKQRVGEKIRSLPKMVFGYR